jgi:hypothetical protein
MDKLTLGLIAGLGTIVAASSVQANTSTEPETVLRATSVAELLKPIPNALEKLRALDAQADVKPAETQVAEKIIIKHDHHHHHHHPYRRHHHHHHHHHMM